MYRAIERNEDHAATMSVLLSLLRAQYGAARGDDLERARLEREIAYYVERQAQLHAERDDLRRQIMNLREGRSE